MTTRAEQVAAGERIARLNPEWTWRDDLEALVRDDDAEVWTTEDRRWLAVTPGGQILRELGASVIAFRTPAEAIRALGYTLSDE